MKVLLESVIKEVSALSVEIYKYLMDALQGLLFTDAYEAIGKNIARLSGMSYSNSAVYRAIRAAVQTAARMLSPSAAMAGVLGLTQVITHTEQEWLNADSVSGKSINALRSFPGKGVLVCEARTLDGNSQEWRYIPVRRFFLIVEESMRRGTSWAVFEANDANLWGKIKSMFDSTCCKNGRKAGCRARRPMRHVSSMCPSAAP